VKHRPVLLFYASSPLDPAAHRRVQEDVFVQAVAERILYEDNHLIVVNKLPGELIQGDRSGDSTLGEVLTEYIRDRDAKPGNVFLGVTHRLDRPTSGVVVFAKTSKALSRLNALFREGKVEKRYWALVDNPPPAEEGSFEDLLWKDSKKNKSFIVAPGKGAVKNAKRALLTYRFLAKGDRYYLLELDIATGRHHQIRCQLAARGMHVRGDLKYGARRSNPDGGISLHARSLAFEHPVGEKGRHVNCVAPPPSEPLWDYFLHVPGIEKETDTDV
jgi:23S rRNA pseudouridine1911/1915/1917 synthase